MHIVIVGTGLGGYTLARELRKRDTNFKLTIISRDHGRFYSKPNLSNALAQKRSIEALTTSSAEKMAAQLNADIRSKTLLSNIDTSDQRIQVNDREWLSYDKLVLAVGAHQVVPPVKGDRANTILTINDLEDYVHFRQGLELARKIVIIGAGLIGCEIANDLTSINKNVRIISLGEFPLDRIVPPEIGERLQQKLTEAGVELTFRTSIEHLRAENSGMVLSLTTGATLKADMVISATGLKPNIELAERAGIQVNRGIVVDRYMATSLENVYALGDCAELDNDVKPYVLPLMTQARALAATLLGDLTPVSYPVMPIVVKTPACPVVVVPPPRCEGKWQFESDNSGKRALYYDNSEKLIGFALCGNKIGERNQWAKQLAS